MLDKQLKYQNIRTRNLYIQSSNGVVRQSLFQNWVTKCELERSPGRKLSLL